MATKVGMIKDFGIRRFPALKVDLPQLVWFVVSILAQAQRRVVAPHNFVTFDSFGELRDSCLTGALIQTYQTVFRLSLAWREEHPVEELVSRLDRELDGRARVALMMADDDANVVGFCWGQILNSQDIIAACVDSESFVALGSDDWAKLRSVLETVLQGNPALFIHELGVLKGYRNGLNPIQFLFRPILELGRENKVRRVIGWTKRRSHVYALCLAIGFKPIAKIGDVVFLYFPNLYPFLRIIRHLHSRQVARLMSLARSRK